MSAQCSKNINILKINILNITCTTSWETNKEREFLRIQLIPTLKELAKLEIHVPLSDYHHFIQEQNENTQKYLPWR